MALRLTRSAAARQVAFASEAKGEPMQLSSPPATPASPKRASAQNKTQRAKSTNKAVRPVKSEPITPSSSRKRVRAVSKIEEDVNELPHNLGRIPTVDGNSIEDEKPTIKRHKAGTPHKASKPDLSKVLEEAVPLVEKITAAGDAESKSAKKKAKNVSYGLTPGSTPYPDYPHPTPEECHEVTRLLSSVHGEVQAPSAIPAPSLTVSGCGEVPSVLDALIRTRLSAATTSTNSSRAFQGLVERFGIIQDGIGKGSVDWDAVRRAETREIFEAIKSGGLADVKSKDIKKILQMVYEENQARRYALTTDAATPPSGAENESSQDRNMEVTRAESHILSLDHLHALSDRDEIMNHLTRYPGIGVKTASCVLLFCLQRPSFAVDTHVFRLCKYLRWVPPEKATRNSTFAHCEVRVPDELKYPLHQLLIKHGKMCPRCRAATGMTSEVWEKGCVIEHLVKRGGGKKGGDEWGTPVKTKNRKGKKGKKVRDEETEEEESELSDLASEEE